MKYLRINIFQKYLLNLEINYIDNITIKFYYNTYKLAKVTKYYN